ncbi:MAG: hypothetical protein HC781_01675 [Leptolyngbyaceae cyanobacterium CSU_1_4]|nr:hypothetical protein [Leptolyngbyaceae cyanobacterium CSU_1_4]
MTELKPGDMVAIAAYAEWIRQGSDSLPEGWWQTLPKSRQFLPTVPISLLSHELFVAFMAEHTVLQISEDGARAKVQHFKNNRVSVFAIEHLQLLEAAP